MNKGNFLENNCTFSLLKPELLKECKPFICGNDDLDDFFMNNSNLYTEQLLGKTYCFRLDEDLSVMTVSKLISYRTVERKKSFKIFLFQNNAVVIRQY